MISRFARLRRAAPILLSLFIAPSLAFAQDGTLQGRVINAASGAPLVGAEVRILGPEARVRTNAEGRYRFDRVSTGAYAVQASLTGYRAAQRAAVIPPGAVVELDLALQTAELRAPQVDVIGVAAEALERIPGSAAVVGQVELQQRIPLSGNEIFRTIPGLYVQEEEGVGMRANIGVRGLDPDRSRNVLVLEDGVPVSLNPYGEPEMYYTPPIDRMARIEVVKGSGSILFGPQTIGGVINYVTPAPPRTPTANVDVRGGTGGLLHLQAQHGGTWNNVGTHVGVLRKQAEDIRGLFFNITDVTGKAVLGLGERSEMGLKLSVYDEESNSTYVGLTEAMFEQNPHQHPSPADRLRVRRYAASATHELLLGANAVLRTTVYGNTISRNWMREDYNNNDSQRTEILLRGTTGNRNRSFDVAGVEPRLQLNHRFAGIRNELDAGFRLHAEWAEDAHINGSTPTSRTGVIRDYELRHGRAASGFLQNRFELGERFYLTPGVRVESFTFDRNILRQRVEGVPTDVDIRSSDRVTEVIPGLGMSWLAANNWTVFAGAHRGFAPPRIKDAFVVQPGTGGQAELVSLQLDAERSWNAELGTRATPVRGVQFEATGFVLDFSNQIIAPSLSAGAVAQAALANQGETRHTGIEGAVGVELGQLAGLPFGLLTELKYTHVRSIFSAERFMRDPAGDTIDVRGNRLPYAPENILVAGLALELPMGLRLRADGTYIGDQFADNFETVAPRPDGRVGLIPAHTVWNVAGTYRLPMWDLELFGTVKNLLGDTYIASRRPEGIMPGLPRTFTLGARVAL
ncbi:MAG: TonB-dependent receptor [Gemmatimonadetes bacterium]|nr:TonB-dependent receptor [Gemmatimonadota bacterium]